MPETPSAASGYGGFCQAAARADFTGSTLLWSAFDRTFLWFYSLPQAGNLARLPGTAAFARRRPALILPVARSFGALLLGLGDVVFLAETLNPAGGIYQLLFTGKEGMAGGTNFHFYILRG
jgi:hypothetical protein